MALKKLVKVKMLVDTAYEGPRKEGDVISVPEDFAHRWVKNKIAELVEVEDTDEDDDITDNGEENGSESEGDAGNEDGFEEINEDEVPDFDYESLTAKELYELCQKKGIEVEAKKSKAYYIEKLTTEE